MSKSENNNTENSVLQLSELPIEDWKAKHKVVKLITVKAKNGTKHQFVIGRPTLAMMDMLSKYINEQKPHKMREVLRNSCVLAGDKQLLDDDDDMRNSIFDRITELFEKLEVEEKEL